MAHFVCQFHGLGCNGGLAALEFVTQVPFYSFLSDKGSYRIITFSFDHISVDIF